MKKIIKILCVLIIVILASCADDNQSGYNCVSGNCSAVFENPQYLTLSDCQSVCASNSSGYNCVSGNCVAVGDSAEYQNLTECEIL